MASEETESVVESCSDTRSERGSEDRVSETESVNIECVDSQKSANKFRSDVWDYFEKNASGKKVQCRLCKNDYAYLGTTSNLRDHLNRYHKDKYKQNDARESGDKQQTSLNIFVNCHKCPTARAKRITELLALMIARDLRPAAIIEAEGFKRVLSFLEPGYVIPSSVHLMDVVRRKYTIAKEKLRKILAENNTKHSLTTDIWTSFANDAYISLTTHFIDDCWQMKSYTLTTYSFPEQHTGDNIVEKLKEVVREYDIDDSSIFAIVHDQGSNFQWAGRLLENDKQWKSVNCAAHCLQLCIIEGFDINTIAQTLTAAKMLVKHHSARATEEL